MSTNEDWYVRGIQLMVYVMKSIVRVCKSNISWLFNFFYLFGKTLQEIVSSLYLFKLFLW